MTEEEFWKSNPWKIKVYEKVRVEEQNRNNKLAHMMVGTYGLSALSTALSQVLTPIFCNKKSSATYMAEPIELFEAHGEALEKKKEQNTNAFINWANSYKKKVTQMLENKL